MAVVDLIMPKMGESIMEATILKWLKNVGDRVELDEAILEIATDKVDSEIPSPVEGVLTEILFPEDEIVEIGKVIARISTEGEASAPVDSPALGGTSSDASTKIEETSVKPNVATEASRETQVKTETASISSSDRFYSPLVKNIAKQEGIQQQELDSIDGSGMNNRVTKKDILAYVENRSSAKTISTSTAQQTTSSNAAPAASARSNASGNVEIIEMDRMRKLIADHMVMSKHTSPHVTSFVEADVTNLVKWRDKVKVDFQKRTGEKITFTPIFIEAVSKAIRDFPLVNVSVEGNQIIKKNDINVGMAAALPSGNLIVPVIKNADSLNLFGLTKAVNDLANRARANKLKPEEIQGGTFTLTNVGTFGNVMGTPIINQPQVAILAVGAIRKKPAVVETEYGDVIAIRHMMFLSLSYDHRVVDGILGGSFLRKVADYLENFDDQQTI